MSIIAHAIQNTVANVHVALQSQQAAQAAVTGEDSQRQARVRHEEVASRENVSETDQSRQGRVTKAGDQTRRGKNRRRKGAPAGGTPQGDVETTYAATAAADSSAGSVPEGESSGHIDLLA